MAYGKGISKDEAKAALKKIAAMSERDVFARMVCGEARGEMLLGQVAVACNPLNRLRDGRFGKTLKGVILKPNAYSCFRLDDANLPLLVAPPKWQLDHFNTLAEMAMGGMLHDPTNGATNYFNPDIVPGGWPRDWNRALMEDCGRIGRHWFWREKK